MSKDGDPRWHQLWAWTLLIERRVSRLEGRHLPVRKEEDDRRVWTPRDYLLTLAGLAVVAGSLTEKAGLTAVGMAILKAVAKVYGEH